MSQFFTYEIKGQACIFSNETLAKMLPVTGEMKIVQYPGYALEEALQLNSRIRFLITHYRP